MEFGVHFFVLGDCSLYPCDSKTSHAPMIFEGGVEIKESWCGILSCTRLQVGRHRCKSTGGDEAHWVTKSQSYLSLSTGLKRQQISEDK